MKFPHLGLGLQLGKIYGDDDLRTRCKEHPVKLAFLETHLRDPTVFRRLDETESYAIDIAALQIAALKRIGNRQ